jgi:outer membrane receptor protein involved in Fe transport
MRKPLLLFFAALLMIGFAGVTWAQTDVGTVRGTVTDTTGAVVPGAQAVAKSMSTNSTHETTTDSVGMYSIAALRPDTYLVTITAKGFESVARTIVVTVGSSNEFSAEIAVAGVQATVTVTEAGGALTVDTETQTMGTVITAQGLSDLPTDENRNPYALVGTAANVNYDSAATTRGVGFSINGLRSSSTSVMLDGGENVDTFTSGIGQYLPIDAIQEFSVLTNNFTAEFGRASGGIVNVVTKSGTNSLHGSAFEYNRVSDLSSNTYYNNANGIPKGKFTRNDFGFSLGGPIVKDKLFFFNNTEWIRVRSNGIQTLTIIDPVSYPLLAAASKAFFSAYGKLAPGVTTKSTGSCGGSGLTCDLVSFAVPSDAGGGSPQNTWMELARVDYNLSNKTNLTGRYTSYKELDFPGTVNASPYAGYNTGQTNYDQNILVSLNHTFGSTLVNSTKFLYNRLNGPVQGLGTAPVGPTLYTSGGVPSVLGAPLVFPGYSETTPGNSIPFGGPQNLYQVYDDLMWSHGKHQFKVGGEYINIRDNRVFGAYLNAVEQLGTTLGTGLANLVNGTIYQFQSAVYPQGKFPCLKNVATGATIVTAACTITLPVSKPDFERNYRYNDMSFYAQDSWKITRRLMLNGGLRWEYYGVQHNATPALDSNFVMGPGATIFNRVRNGLVELAQNGGVFWKPGYGNFGPRIGFAWTPFGDSKTVIRGGYGIGYERNFGNVTFNAIQNPPNYAVVSLISGLDVPTMPVFTDNNGPLAGNSGSKALPQVSQRAIDQNVKTAYAETWNLTVERQVTGSSTFSVAYAGSHGVHLYDISNVNPSLAGGTFLGDAHASNRLNLGYTNMNFRSDHAYSHYNALVLEYKVVDLFKKGLSVHTNYTWSHALDNLSSTFTESNLGAASGAYYLGYLDGFNPKLNYGNADYDIRHRFVLNTSWEVPWMKNAENAVERNALGGWVVGLSFNMRSGVPFSIFDCTNLGGTNCPEWVPPGAVPKTGSAVPAGPNFSPDTFNYITLPNTGGVVNNVGDALGMPICSGLYHTGCVYSASGLPYPERNNYFGPRFWNANMTFLKNFKLTERFQLQFRTEMYNIFNHSNMYVNTFNIDASSLVDNNGTPTPFIQAAKGAAAGFPGSTADERRNIQFGLRLSF